jgi:predicted ATPase
VTVLYEAHPEQDRLAALTNWVMAGARVQPVVLAFEDLHWADPTTLDVLRGIAERGALAPLFVVATTRPEFRPPRGMRSHHGTISLALDRAQVQEMVAELSARHALPREVVEDVAARTGGVPLFVEEVTRLLLERGEQGGIHTIPPTLQQSLMARLDRLEPAREVAQIGSVIGRGFSYSLLRDVAGIEDAALQAALEKSPTLTLCWSRGCRPRANIVSSTRSFRTRLTKICSRAGARFCTAASPRVCAIASPPLRRPSRNRLRITSLRRA